MALRARQVNRQHVQMILDQLRHFVRLRWQAQCFLEQLDELSDFMADHGYAETVLFWQLQQTRFHLTAFIEACGHSVVTLEGRFLKLLAHG